MIDPLDLRSFDPVEPLSVIPETFRQTLLAKSTECPRSAYLYVKYNGGALTHPLAGGTLLHRTVERVIRHMMDQEPPEKTIAPETAKDMLNEVLVESTDLTVSPDRFDSLRAMIFHLAEGLAIEPENVVFLERPVSVEIAGHTVTGTIDFGELEVSELGTHALCIEDWKSAFFNAARPDTDPEDDEYVPTKEEWPGTFQLVLYAYAAATGTIAGAPPGFNFGEIPEWRLKQVHPRQFWENEGTMAYREAVITREALLDWRLYLEAEVIKLAKAFETWDFPAIRGSHCDYCPASAECPIPAPLREYQGEIRTAEDAARAASIRDRHMEAAAELWKGIKGFSKATGRKVRYGKDLELRWKKVESEKIKDRVEAPGSRKKIKGRIALREAIRRTEEFGIPLDWNYFHTPSVSTRLTKRTLTPEELTAEREGEAK